VIVISPIVLKMLMSNIVEATHSLTDDQGARVMIGTIDEKTLRMAAISAIQDAVREVVWPGDRAIVFKDGPRQQGIFRIER
jgi:hypothetical protein